MIFFGTKGRSIKIDSGKFHCPSCKVEKEYEKKYVQDWFTIIGGILLIVWHATGDESKKNKFGPPIKKV